MSDSDNQWPSEDEDFDTVTDAEQLRKEVTQTDQQTADNQSESETVSNDQNTSSDNNNEQQANVDEQVRVEPEAVSTEQGEVAAAEPEEQMSQESNDDQPHEEVQQPDYATVEESHSEIEQEDATPATEDNQITPEESSSPAISKQPAVSKKPSSPSNVIRYGIEGLLIVAVIALGLSVLTLKSDNNSLKKQVTTLNNNPQLQLQRQTQQIIDAVGKLVQLPSGETPTIATVTNATQAKTQSTFFDSAQNGDKVLMYVKAGQAILYRPSTDKVINVAPLTFTSSSTGNATSSTSTGSTTK